MKLEFSYKKVTGKFHKYVEIKQHTTNQWVEEIKRNNYLETNENGSTTCHNLWDTATVVIKGKFMAINAYLKQEKSQTT